MTEERSQSAVFGLFARELVGSGVSIRFCARGRSMWPTIQDGDMLEVKPIQKSPKLGDIVLFLRAGRFTAHRIVGKRGSGFVTRGDAGWETDGVIRREDIFGKIVALHCSASGRKIALGTLDRMRFFVRQARKFAARQLRGGSFSLSS